MCHTLSALGLAPLLAVASTASCDLARIVAHGRSSVEDMRLFSNRTIAPSPAPFHFRDETASGHVPDVLMLEGRAASLPKLLEENDTLAFLVVRGHDLLYERYFKGFDRSTPSLGMSISKSVLSLLVGCAAQDGLLSVEQPVTDLVPELRSRGFDRVRIEHLLQMTAGTDYRESDLLWGDTPWFYWGTDLEARLLRLEVVRGPGTEFVYKSGDTALLGLALSRAVRPRTITSYLQERVWSPLGMEYGGVWSLDHPNGLEKTFCCLAATAIDFAKIGRLYARQGEWEGRTIIPARWVQSSSRPPSASDGGDGCDDFARCDFPLERSGGAWYYRYQWWLVSRARGDFMASGHLGQYLYVDPARSLVIVRLGRSLGHLDHRQWRAVLVDVAGRVR